MYALDLYFGLSVFFASKTGLSGEIFFQPLSLDSQAISSLLAVFRPPVGSGGRKKSCVSSLTTLPLNKCPRPRQRNSCDSKLEVPLARGGVSPPSGDYPLPPQRSPGLEFSGEPRGARGPTFRGPPYRAPSGHPSHRKNTRVDENRSPE